MLLENIESINIPGKEPTTDNILHKYMIEIARSGNLKMCERIIRESRPIESLPLKNRIIKNQLQLLQTALDVVYECNDVNQLSILNEIFEVTFLKRYH